MTIVTVLAWRGSSFCVLGVETLVGGNYQSTFLVGKKMFYIPGDGLIFSIPPVGLGLIMMAGLAYYFRGRPMPNLLRLWPRPHAHERAQ